MAPTATQVICHTSLQYSISLLNYLYEFELTMCDKLQMNKRNCFVASGLLLVGGARPSTPNFTDLVDWWKLCNDFKMDQMFYG